MNGVISSAVNHGVYVELPNTVEGLIRVADLGDYQYDGKMEFVDQHSWPETAGGRPHPGDGGWGGCLRRQDPTLSLRMRGKASRPVPL